MPKFFYIAKDNKGKKITAVQEKSDQNELIAQLQAQGLVVMKIQPYEKATKATKAKEEARKIGRKRMHSRITTNDLTLFCRQLGTLLGAGVTIIESLKIIQQQIASRSFLKVLEELREGMEGGLSFHEAMAKKPKIFSQMWINLVESGEASGNLAIVLSRLASYLERDAKFRSQIISALIYPIILMTVGIGALFFLTIKIIPTFANLFASFKMDLPVLTKGLIAVSAFIRKYILFLILGVIVLVFFIRGYINKPEGKKRYEGLLLRLPVMGDFFHNLLIERFSSGMATLIESGVPILYSLDISERSIGNLVMADVIREVKKEVSQGRSMSIPMEKTDFFEPMVVQMVRIGEEIGDLAGMLKKINSFYQEYVETFLARFTAMFEPIMLVFIGGIIGIMVVGMFLPIFQISQMGGGGF